MKRYLEPYLLADLKKKMVFLGGPRQCGKTTVSKSVIESFGSPHSDGEYLNWDSDRDRRRILKRDWPEDRPLIVLDELHKFPKWKAWMKGVYDTRQKPQNYLVTGSARLDVYRRGGDSLLGRYHYWRLHPFTLSEHPASLSGVEAYKRLMSIGGFPEPFLENDERQARRWRRERMDRVLRDDVRDLEGLNNVQGLEMLVDLLRQRVGGAVVMNNLAGDLQVSPITVKKWIEALEKMYLLFQVRPYTHARDLPRAVQKPPKIYFFDNGDVEDEPGARFENLVAGHLLKTIHFLEDRDGHRYELRYVRDKEKREVDFLILKDKRPIELIEAKWADTAPSSALNYFGDKLGIKTRTQIVGTPGFKAVTRSGIRVVSALEDLRVLERPSLL